MTLKNDCSNGLGQIKIWDIQALIKTNLFATADNKESCRNSEGQRVSRCFYKERTVTPAKNIELFETVG